MSEWKAIKPKRTKGAIKSGSLAPNALTLAQPAPQGRFAALATSPSRSSAETTRTESPRRPKRQLNREEHSLTKASPSGAPVTRSYEASIKLPDAKTCDDFVRRIARETNTQIRFTHGQHRNKSDFRFWGDHAEVVKAVSSLDSWVRDFSSSNDIKTFARVMNMTEDKLIIAERGLDESEDLAFFRRAPDPSVPSEASAIFMWPSETRAENVLGPDCQLLDQIRIQHRCHIVLDNDLVALRVSGRSADVTTVLELLRDVYFFIEAQNPDPLQSCVVLWPYACIKATHVKLLQTNDMMLIRGIGNSKDFDMEHVNKLRFTQGTLKRALRNASCYCGKLDLRFRFGPLVLQKYRRFTEISLTDFNEMMAEEAFEAHVDESLCRAISCDVLPNLLQADDIFERPSLSAKSLHDLHPTFTTHITIGDKDGDILLKRTFEQVAVQDEYDSISTDWLRVDSARFLDLKMIDVCSGLAWAIELNGSRCIPKSRLKQTVQDYISYYFKIKPKIRPLHSVNTPWISLFGLTKVKHIRQEITWTYRIRDSDYRIYYSKAQDFDYGATGEVVGCGPEQSSISVTNPDWEAIFAGNRNLTIGERPAWGEKLESNFPVAENEMGKLVKTLCKVQEAALGV